MRDDNWFSTNIDTGRKAYSLFISPKVLFWTFTRSTDYLLLLYVWTTKRSQITDTLIVVHCALNFFPIFQLSLSIIMMIVISVLFREKCSTMIRYVCIDFILLYLSIVRRKKFKEKKKKMRERKGIERIKNNNNNNNKLNIIYAEANANSRWKLINKIT